MFFPRLNKLQQAMESLTERFCKEKGLTKHAQRLNQYLGGRVNSYTSTDKELLEMFYQFNEWCEETPEADHPVGVVLGPARGISPHSGKELYRVSFAETIYEEVHPIQLEVINEV